MELRLLTLAVGLWIGFSIARPQSPSNVDVKSTLTQLFAGDTNRAQNSQVTIDYQNMASKKSPDHDNAPNPLFTINDASLLSKPTYSSFRNLLATYTIPNVDVADPTTSDRSQAINLFLAQISSTSVFSTAWQYLQDNGLASKDLATFQQQLSSLWFTPFARNSIVGSSGFESVFVGELQGNNVVRMNNWIGYYTKEKDSIFDYHGWFTRNKGVNIELQWMWGQAEALDKSFLLMTSPEVELMAYTVCALAGNGQPCPATISGIDVTLQVTTRLVGQMITIDDAYPTADQAAATTKSPNTKAPPDADFQAVVDAMRAADIDRAADSDYVLNWGNPVNGDKDVSPDPLFTSLNEDVFQKDIYQKQIYIYDQQFFHADTCTEEQGMSGFRKTAIMDWLSVVTNSTVFQQAYQYLLAKGKCTDLTDLTNRLIMLWWGTYGRCTSNKNIMGSSGWEHVFCGEWKGSTVDGHHSWVNYYRQEKAGQINYHGYYHYDKQLTGTFQYDWVSDFKEKGGFLIGTSPMFDFSLLSLCVLMHPNGANCKFSIDGFPLGVINYTQDCDAGTCISTAYPTDT